MHKRYYVLFLLFTLLSFCLNAQTHIYKPFSSINTQRNGSYCFYNALQDLFANKVDTSTAGINKFYNDYVSNIGIVIVNAEIKFSSEERTNLLSFVRRGNVVMIAGLNFEHELTSLLGISIPDYNMERLKDSTILYLDNDAISPFKNYSHYTMRNDYINNYISYTPYNGMVLGRNTKNEINFIKLKYGEGIFYIHTAPFLFGNDFLLKNDNAKYVETVMSHMPNSLTRIYYDEHIYNFMRNSSSIAGSSSGSSGSGSGGGDEEPSKLDYILKDPNLKPAFYLSLLAIFLAALFAALRKQRPIKLIPPVKNNSKELVNSISDVYLNQQDNKVIADKKIKFFNETLRSKYGLQSSDMNQEFWNKLFNKTGMASTEFNELQNAIVYCNNNVNISNAQLINLSNKLDKFYKL